MIGLPSGKDIARYINTHIFEPRVGISQHTHKYIYKGNGKKRNILNVHQ